MTDQRCPHGFANSVTFCPNEDCPSHSPKPQDRIPLEEPQIVSDSGWCYLGIDLTPEQNMEDGQDEELFRKRFEIIKSQILSDAERAQRLDEELQKALEYREGNKGNKHYNQGDANAELIIKILQQIRDGKK